VEVLVSYRNPKYVRSNDTYWSHEGYDACRADETTSSYHMEWCFKDRSQVRPVIALLEARAGILHARIFHDLLVAAARAQVMDLAAAAAASAICCLLVMFARCSSSAGAGGGDLPRRQRLGRPRRIELRLPELQPLLSERA
jgi:hypothetical protein